MRASDPHIGPHLTEPITTQNFVNTLAQAMIGQIPFSDIEDAIPRMPPWAGALTRLSAGFKYQQSGELEKAATSFRQYHELVPGQQQGWAFTLQPLADNLARQSDEAFRTLEEIDRLEKQQEVIFGKTPS